MKNVTIAGLLMLALIFSSGCKKDSDETTSPNTLSVKIDGTSWNAGHVVGLYSAQGNLTVIMGTNLDLTEQLQLAFAGSDVGTYNFAPDDYSTFGSFIISPDLEGYSTYLQDVPSGQVIVTEFDKANNTISGSFRFEAYNMDNVKKTFTEGKFTKIKYELQ